MVRRSLCTAAPSQPEPAQQLPADGDSRRRSRLASRGPVLVEVVQFGVQTGITKGINARIEKTMTARTGGDGGQLHILKDQDDGAPLGASLKSASFSKTQKKK